MDNVGVPSNGRTSSNTWIKHDHDEITKRVGLKIANIVNLPLENAEKYQVIYYGETQEYRPHYDSWVHDGSEKTLRCMKRGGARMKTALCYLNDVSKGGGTKMTKLDITIPPKKGSLLVFQNTISETNHDRHPLSEHAGLPVEEGEKYAFNLWFKECNSQRLYQDYNPGYYAVKQKPTIETYTRNRLSLQLNSNNLSNQYEIYKDTSFFDQSVCDKLVSLSKFNTNIRRDAWVKVEQVPELTEKIELLMGIKKEYFENINIVEYKSGELHNKHFVAYDLDSNKGMKYTKTLGQRLYTLTLALSDEIVIEFPNTKSKTTTELNRGDILITNNVNPTNVHRNEDMERTILNLSLIHI